MILCVDCPDRPGLVAAVAEVLFGVSADIKHAEQHADAESRRFFQRLVFDVAADTRPKLEQGLGELAQRFAMRWRMRWPNTPARVALFASREPHCLDDLLGRFAAQEMRGEAVLVLANHAEREASAKRFGLPFVHTPFAQGDREAVEAAQLEALRVHQVDLLVLARYMRILSDNFLQAVQIPVINIHHSFLPAFAGARPYHQAFKRGVKCVGATAHYATRDLDEGPIIEQDMVRVSHRDAVSDLVQKGRDVERVVLARAVKWHLEERVLQNGERTVVFA